METNPKYEEMKELGSVLLETGSLLMISGASTGRIINTINRIASSFGVTTDLFVTHRALMINLRDENKEYFFDSLKEIPSHGVNFKVVSGVSRMSWKVVNENWNTEQIHEELQRLSKLPHYSRITILLLVALAGASFCRINGGEVQDMIVTFIATFAGLFIRQQATKMKFNHYMCVYFGAFVASALAGAALKYGGGYIHERAFATSVLYLIPGVPLINSFSDMIVGNLLNGIIRGMNGFIMSFAIALGLLTSMFIYHF